jgi:hypothetical protein
MTPEGRSGRSGLIAVLERLAAEWSASPRASWENDSLPRYLEALAAWLHDCEGYYQNQGRTIPDDPWKLLADALQAAKIYE